jgi:hypothetical protein
MQDITDNLPDIILKNIAAHNQRNADAFIATFASDALLNDAKREFVGLSAIRAWAQKEIFNDNVILKVSKAYANHSNIIVHGIITGDFDKSNLPDPLILTYYYSLQNDKIFQLAILLNTVIWEPQHV